MPKKSNEFQKLILFLQKHCITNTRITESKILIDKLIGIQREVDIYIETKVGDHNIRISIECTDKSRPSDINWIELMKNKHEKLDTDKLILVNKKGYTEPAKKLAEKYNIQLLRFEELSNMEGFIIDPNSFSIKSYTYLVQFVIVQTRNSNKDIKSVKIPPDIIIFDINGKEECSADEVITTIMKSDKLEKDLLENGTLDHKYFTVDWEISKLALFIQESVNKSLELITNIHIQGKIDFTLNNFKTSVAKVGDRHFIWGKANVNTKSVFLIGTLEENLHKITVSDEEQKMKFI